MAFSLQIHDLFDLVHAIQLQRSQQRGYFRPDTRRVYYIPSPPADDALLPLPDITAAMLEGAMRDFALKQDREGAAQTLLEALTRPHPRRAYRQALDRLELRADWMTFRDERYAAWARAWCRQQKISF